MLLNYPSLSRAAERPRHHAVHHALSAGDSSRTGVQVFKGKVRIEREGKNIPLNAGTALAFHGSGSDPVPARLDEGEFPHPASLLTNILPSGGFERGTAVSASGPPNRPGIWSGDGAIVTGALNGVKPLEGSGMLSFGIQNERAAGQWQVVDLNSIKQAAPGLPVEARFSASFNRAQAAASQGTFAITVAAFRGPFDRAAASWSGRSRAALALAQQSLLADRDPSTWERLEAQIVLAMNFGLSRMATNPGVAILTSAPGQLVRSRPQGSRRFPFSLTLRHSNFCFPRGARLHRDAWRTTAALR